MGINNNDELFPYEGTFTIHIEPGLQLPRIPPAVTVEGDLFTAAGRISRSPTGFLFVVEHSLRGPGGEFTLEESAIRTIQGDFALLFQKKEN